VNFRTAHLSAIVAAISNNEASIRGSYPPTPFTQKYSSDFQSQNAAFSPPPFTPQPAAYGRTAGCAS
jgi:hypothetical protein